MHEGDALAWLEAQGELPGCSLVTSLPDVCELPLDFAQWRKWFVDAAASVLRACPPEGVAIFYQTGNRWLPQVILRVYASCLFSRCQAGSSVGMTG